MPVNGLLYLLIVLTRTEVVSIAGPTVLLYLSKSTSHLHERCNLSTKQICKQKVSVSRVMKETFPTCFRCLAYITYVLLHTLLGARKQWKCK